MEVAYTQSKEDIAAFRRFHARHRAKGRGLTLFLNGFLVLVWGLQLGLLVHAISVWRLLLPVGPRMWGPFLQMHQHLLVNFVLLTLLLAYLFWGQKMLLARQGGNMALLAQPKHLRIGPEGVDVFNAQEQVTRTWKDIPDIGSDSDRIYLYLTKATALVVPRRAFLSLQDAQQFEAQARRFHDSPQIGVTDGTDRDDSSVWPPRPVMRAAPLPSPSAAPFADIEHAPGAIVLSYTTTKADLARAQLFFLPRRPAAWLGAFIPYALAAAVWTVPRFPLAPALLWAVGVAALGTLLTLAWATHKTLTHRFVQFPQGWPCRTIASPGVLCDITPEGRKLYPWQEVTAIQMQAGDIYVLCKTLGSMVIPRSAFADSRMAADFAGTLRGFWQQGKNVPARLESLVS